MYVVNLIKCQVFQDVLVQVSQVVVRSSTNWGIEVSFHSNDFPELGEWQETFVCLLGVLRMQEATFLGQMGRIFGMEKFKVTFRSICLYLSHSRYLADLNMDCKYNS